MKMIKFFLVEMVLPLITAWFLMTLLVDIVAIPTVFKNISNLEEGGRIGMSIFGKFNCLEIFLALGVLAGVSSMKDKSRVLIGLSVLLLAFSLFYTFYMTPMIGNTTVEIHKLALTDPQYQVLTERHRTYHDLYRTFDSTKLILLLVFGGLMLRYNSQRSLKEHV